MKNALNGRFCAMIDCSRNGVMKVQTVKTYMDLLAKMGYNSIMLYTEDTWEVQNEPYFGYLRGRYSTKELRELDCYAKKVGLELIPCIQTLAHLNAIFRWKEYQPIRDANDILLLNDERTYELIDNMFATIKNTFSTDLVHIGMDEAHMLGRGRYADIHGIRSKFDLMTEHLNRVSKIAEKYGLKTIMWSDMFLRIANDGDYYGKNPIPEEIAKKIPSNVNLIYWDYYHTEEQTYRDMIDAHSIAKEGMWFAGGSWVWSGFAPNIEWSFKTTTSALRVCKERGVQNIIMTLWGDFGRECSCFNALSMLYHAIQIYKGNEDMQSIKDGFNRLIGEYFEDFALLEIPNQVNGNIATNCNPSKYMLYNDPFMGIFDYNVYGGEAEYYKKQKGKLLKAMKRSKSFGYLFELQYHLCNVLQTKYDLGVRTRKAYKAKDKEGLSLVAKDYLKTVKSLRKFLACLEALWYRENKGTGLEIQQIRLGGLIQRLLSCNQKLQEYVSGKIDIIDELEQEILDEYNFKENKGFIIITDWPTLATANVV